MAAALRCMPRRGIIFFYIHSLDPKNNHVCFENVYELRESCWLIILTGLKQVGLTLACKSIVFLQ